MSNVNHCLPAKELLTGSLGLCWKDRVHFARLEVLCLPFKIRKTKPWRGMFMSFSDWDPSESWVSENMTDRKVSNRPPVFLVVSSDGLLHLCFSWKTVALASPLKPQTLGHVRLMGSILQYFSCESPSWKGVN